MDLGIDEDDLNACVQCGLCLPHCPTFRVTGDETRSPRGRIRLMREVQDHDAPLTREVLDGFDTCIQCRGCEPACPSGVRYGSMMEATRSAISDQRPMTSRAVGLALEPLRHPRLLRAATKALGGLGAVGGLPSRLGLPSDLPTTWEPLQPTGDDVVLFTGCVMDAWQREVHEATIRVVTAAGIGVAVAGDAAPCCGALHAHAGRSRTARTMAADVIAALPDRPVLVNSAGCGAAMKEYGEHLGTAAARAFSARVFDVSEYLADHVDRLPAVTPLPFRVAVQDPCHLRHVQRVHEATRTVLAPFVETLLELDDDGLCCGAGGAFSVLQPGLAAQVRDRKVTAIDRVSPDLVASANPGCALHLAGADVLTRHPMQIIDDALTAAAASPNH